MEVLKLRLDSADPGFHWKSMAPWALTWSIQAVKINTAVSETLQTIYLPTSSTYKKFVTNMIPGYMALSSSFHNLQQQKIKEVVLHSTKSKLTAKR